MLKIYKYALHPPRGEGTVVPLQLPRGARLLSVTSVRDTIVAYAAVSPDEDVFNEWLFHVVPTGVSFSVRPLLLCTFLGTVKLQGDSLVFHVFCEDIALMTDGSGQQACGYYWRQRFDLKRPR